MKVNIYNQATSRISSRTNKNITRIVSYVIKKENASLSDLNVIITNDSYIKELNKKFLNKNRPTNVLAFNMEEVSEIYISYDQVDSSDDLLYCIVHGLLHILGYDHGKQETAEAMRNKCLKYLKHITERTK